MYILIKLNNLLPFCKPSTWDWSAYPDPADTERCCRRPICQEKWFVPTSSRFLVRFRRHTWFWCLYCNRLFPGLMDGTFPTTSISPFHSGGEASTGSLEQHKSSFIWEFHMSHVLDFSRRLFTVETLEMYFRNALKFD